MEPDLKTIVRRFREEIVRTASELIRIPSYSLREKAAADYVEEKMRALGYDEVFRDVYGSVFGVIRGAGGGASVLLNCHLDTVEEGDRSLWERPPFGGEVAGGRIWGRGASDTKGTMAIQLYAPVMLREADLLPAGDIVTAAVVAEENAGFGSMMQCRDGHYLTDYAILGEATENDLAIANRGRCCVRITLRGRACHAAMPRMGCNPFDCLARLLPRLGEIPLEQDGVLGASSLTVTKIESSEEGTNIVPSRVTAYCDCRLSAGENAESVCKKIQTAADEIQVPGVTVESDVLFFPLTTYTGVSGRGFQGEPSFAADRDEPYIQRCREALEAAVGHQVALKPWPFATDAGHYAARGVKVIGYSPAESALCHTASDSISILKMEEAAVGYIALIRTLADRPLEERHEK